MDTAASQSPSVKGSSGGYLKNDRVNLEGINLDHPISYRWALSYGKIGIFWIPTRGPKLVAWWSEGGVSLFGGDVFLDPSLEVVPSWT